MKVSCFRYLASFLLLWVEPSCVAQPLTIRVINAVDGRPLQKQKVSVSLLYEKGERTPPRYDTTLNLETDVNGEAHFRLPDPAPAHLSAQVHLPSERWRCGCGILAVIQDLIQKGAVELPGASRKSPLPLSRLPQGKLSLSLVRCHFLNDSCTHS